MKNRFLIKLFALALIVGVSFTACKDYDDDISGLTGQITNLKSQLDAINAKDFATETTLASLIQYIDQLETKLDTLNSKDFATDTNLESIKSKLDTLNLNDFATETTLASLIAYIDDIETKLDGLNTLLTQPRALSNPSLLAIPLK